MSVRVNEQKSIRLRNKDLNNRSMVDEEEAYLVEIAQK